MSSYENMYVVATEGLIPDYIGYRGKVLGIGKVTSIQFEKVVVEGDQALLQFRVTCENMTADKAGTVTHVGLLAEGLVFDQFKLVTEAKVRKRDRLHLGSLTFTIEREGVRA